MHNEYKRQSPYRGFIITLFILIVPGLLCYLAIDAAIMKYSPWPYDLDKASSQALGCLFTFFFHMIALLCGLFTPGWQAVKFRVVDFFESLIVGFGYACKNYAESMWEDGVTFDIHMAIIGVNLYFLVDGVRTAMALLPD